MRLDISPISRRATLTRRSKRDPRLAVGPVTDVHEDFLAAVLTFLEHGDVEMVIYGQDRDYVVTCTPHPKGHFKEVDRD